jgi:hypothetical protein
MPKSKNKNASIAGGASLSKLAGGGSGQNKLASCSADDIAKVVRDLQANGLALKGPSGVTQLSTLPKALKHRGPRGLSTYEGVAAGYLRIATRVKELKSTWEILTLRESYVGPDGLYHQGVARYVLIGRRADQVNPQGTLDLGGVQ